MRVAVTVAAALVSVLVFAGCVSTSGSSGSRDELYSTVSQLSANSALVVVGRVTLQDNVDDPQATVVSTIEVGERFVTAGLGNGLPGGTPIPDKIGGVLQVRQVTKPYLETGQSYLLFLVPSGLPGEAGGQYFVTGANAGMYHVEGTNFVHGDFTEGDTLPGTLTRADLG
ncbi:MAG: hypothetical protein ABI632_05050 [Pseudolysinimonas sp.]